MLSQENKYIKYIFYLGILNVLLATLLYYFWELIFKDARSMAGITFALALFFLCELFIILFTERKSKTLNSRQIVNLFLGYKAGKIFLSLLFIAIYASIIKVEIARFIWVYVLLYFIFLAFDTFYLVTREKRMKTKAKLKEPDSAQAPPKLS